MKLLSGGNFFRSCYSSVSVPVIYIMTAHCSYRKGSRFGNGYDCPVNMNRTFRHYPKFLRYGFPLDYACDVSFPGYFIPDSVWYSEFLCFLL